MESTPPAGKTSQVLAKLTAECDKLRREIKAEKAAKEEAVQQFQALKGRVNWLEDKNSTLTMQLDANESALTRKERRMDDLKTSNEEEKGRRKRAEEREAEMGRKLGETVSQAAKDVSEAHMAQKHAENAYATLENEYNGLQRRILFLKKEVDTLTGKINDNSRIHKEQLTQLEVLLDQQRHQQEKSERQVQEMSALLREYRDTEENTKRLETEMQDAVHEMRWVMRLHQSREGEDAYSSSRQAHDSVIAPVPTKSRHASSPSKSKPRKAPLANGVPL
jgi:chromosome segregation ATPase